MLAHLEKKCLWAMFVGLSAVMGGCAHSEICPQEVPVVDAPRELDMATHPIYRVAPPDILILDAVNNIRPADSRLRAGDQLIVQIAKGLPIEPDVDPEINPLEYQAALQFEQNFKIVNGPYLIGADGNVDLGPAYGGFPVAGLTVDKARDLIEAELKSRLGLKAPQVAVVLPDIGGRQEIAGEHLVRPDGTISLGIYGGVRVAGLSLDEIKMVVEQHLSRYINEPEISVDILSYNSRAYYVISDGGGFGERVIRFPCTGNETVLDAISQVEGLSEVSSRNVWVARPAPAGTGCAQILDVNWKEIAAEGITTTNYQVLPGDRIYVKADPLISLDNALSKIIAPVERVFGVILLGNSTADQLQRGAAAAGQGGGGLGGGF